MTNIKPLSTSHGSKRKPHKITCDSCGERFKNNIDLEAHLFNNIHCNPKQN